MNILNLTVSDIQIFYDQVVQTFISIAFLLNEDKFQHTEKWAYCVMIRY